MDLYGTVYRCANRLRSCEHNISFKLLSDIPSSADAVTNGTIAQTDGIKYNKSNLAEIDLSVCQNFFVSFQPDDLRNNSRLLELLLKLNWSITGALTLSDLVTVNPHFASLSATLLPDTIPT